MPFIRDISLNGLNCKDISALFCYEVNSFLIYFIQCFSPKTFFHQSYQIFFRIQSQHFSLSIFHFIVAFFLVHEILFEINFVDDSGIQYTPSDKHANAWDGLTNNSYSNVKNKLHESHANEKSVIRNFFFVAQNMNYKFVHSECCF